MCIGALKKNCGQDFARFRISTPVVLAGPHNRCELPLPIEEGASCVIHRGYYHTCLAVFPQCQQAYPFGESLTYCIYFLLRLITAEVLLS